MFKLPFSISCLKIRTKSLTLKNIEKTRFFIGFSMFFKDRPYDKHFKIFKQLWNIVYKTRRHEHNLFRFAENLQILAFGSSLGSILGLLHASWPFLAASWTLLGALGRLLGASWASLGCLLGVPWWLLSLLAASWAHLEPFGIDFERFQEGLGRVWMGSGPWNNCFFILNTGFSLNPKCKTQSAEFSSLCLSNYNDAREPSMPAAHPILFASELPSL